MKNTGWLFERLKSSLADECRNLIFHVNFLCKVIGDRKAEQTASALASQISILEEIREVVQVPIKLIHVTRNPFDNIATMMLGATKSRDAVRDNGLKVRAVGNNHTILVKPSSLCTFTTRSVSLHVTPSDMPDHMIRLKWGRQLRISLHSGYDSSSETQGFKGEGDGKETGDEKK